ncbi:MAG TPA: succinate dehydrogenase/fumarate reductase iron-sulfur subunit, partial [Desulfobacterales bacterium]|nr:succinate dehydrogenase/fumarate reductase iron-sulfur subunit [Desulfobacterales bacterium]
MERTMKNSYRLILEISRWDPDSSKAWIQEYELEVGGILRFTDVFRRINEELDPTLSWNSSCEHGQCGTCSVMLNGRPILACELLVENAVSQFGTTKFKISPIGVAPVVRDLVVDLELAYERVHRSKPYVIKPAENPMKGREYLVSPRTLERYVEATRCINCFCCAAACISSHKGFLGPNAMLASIVRLMDPRESEK